MIQDIDQRSSRFRRANNVLNDWLQWPVLILACVSTSFLEVEPRFQVGAGGLAPDDGSYFRATFSGTANCSAMLAQPVAHWEIHWSWP